MGRGEWSGKGVVRSSVKRDEGSSEGEFDGLHETNFMFFSMKIRFFTESALYDLLRLNFSDLTGLTRSF